MSYRSRFEELSRRGDHRSLLALGRDAIQSDIVNDVLIGVVAAGDVFDQYQDEALGVAYDAGGRVGYLFQHEAARTWREHPIMPGILSAFEAQAYRLGPNPHNLRYDRSRDHALLIQGDEVRYLDTVNEFREFLVDELGFDPNNILDMVQMVSDGCITINGPLTQDKIDSAFVESRKIASSALMSSSGKLLSGAGGFSNLVIYHNGHGNEGGFRFMEEHVPYHDWARPLAGHRGNMVFVNDTCYATTAHKPLRSLGILPGKMMVISASDSNEGSRGNIFSRNVMEDYRNSRPYKPRTTEEKGQDCIFLDATLTQKGLEIHSVSPGSLNGGVKQTSSKTGIDLDYILMRFSDTQTLA